VGSHVVRQCHLHERDSLETGLFRKSVEEDGFLLSLYRLSYRTNLVPLSSSIIVSSSLQSSLYCTIVSIFVTHLTLYITPIRSSRPFLSLEGQPILFTWTRESFQRRPSFSSFRIALTSRRDFISTFGPLERKR
jgi:hypothetical protein